MGGVLTAVLLGPSAAILVLTCVLLVQSFVFADGGVTALGANVFNMAIVNICAGYGVYLAFRRWIPVGGTRGVVFASAFSAWLGTVLASVSCAGQLSLSRTVAWSAALPAMVNIHMLIGLGEAVATGLITAAILRSRPSLMWVSNMPEPAPRKLLGYGLLLCLGLAVFVAPFASPWPDGLARVAHVLGFESKAVEPVVSSPMAVYELPGIGSPVVATSLAGLIGTLVAFAAAYLLARSLVPNLPDSKRDVTSGT
jgi:cobalt/nickel transport system permease protein